MVMFTEKSLHVNFGFMNNSENKNTDTFSVTHTHTHTLHSGSVLSAHN